jgi:hypothetical protein
MSENTNKNGLCIFNNIYEFLSDDLILKTAYYYLQCDKNHNKSDDTCNTMKNNIEYMNVLKKQLEDSYYKCKFNK